MWSANLSVFDVRVAWSFLSQHLPESGRIHLQPNNSHKILSIVADISATWQQWGSRPQVAGSPSRPLPLPLPPG
jgi:hypothetical protein